MNPQLSYVLRPFCLYFYTELTLECCERRGRKLLIPLIFAIKLVCQPRWMRSILCWLSGSSSQERWEVEISVPSFLDARNLKVVVPQPFFILNMEWMLNVEFKFPLVVTWIKSRANEIIMRTWLLQLPIISNSTLQKAFRCQPSSPAPASVTGGRKLHAKPCNLEPLSIHSCSSQHE